MTDISRVSSRKSVRVVEDSGNVRTYTRFDLAEYAKTFDVDSLGFEINKGDYVWYVDGYNDPLKIGEVVGKTKSSVRVSSFVAGVVHSERNVPRQRVYRLDPDYLVSLAQTADGFILPPVDDDDTVVDIAGNVLTVGDPVLFSNRKEAGFVMGVIDGIKSSTKISVKTFTMAFTQTNWTNERSNFSTESDRQTYVDATPANATDISTHGRVARSSNIIKITSVPNRDIAEFYNASILSTLMKLANLFIEEGFKGNENDLFELEYTYNSASAKIPYVHNGFDMTVVSNGVESFKRLNVEQVPPSPPKTVYITLR